MNLSKILRNVVIVVLAGAGSWCCSKRPEPLPIKYFESTFEDNTDEWTGEAAYYKEGQEATVGLTISQETMPGELKQSTITKGLRVQATNSGDSLFVFVKKKITGLLPDSTYKLAFEINLATNYVDTANGAGRIVYFKAGGASTEPTKILKNAIYTSSIKNGALARSGTEMLLLGNMGNGLDSTAFKAITRTNPNLAVEVKADHTGALWLCVGANTARKGVLSFYIDRIYAAVGEKY